MKSTPSTIESLLCNLSNCFILEITYLIGESFLEWYALKSVIKTIQSLKELAILNINLSGTRQLKVPVQECKSVFTRKGSTSLRELDLNLSSFIQGYIILQGNNTNDTKDLGMFLTYFIKYANSDSIMLDLSKKFHVNRK